MPVIDSLRGLYRDHRLIPFIGAGVSMSLKWIYAGAEVRGPSWTELVNQAAKELGFDIPDLLRVRGTDLQILEYFRLKTKDSASLKNWLVRTMCPSDSELSASLLHDSLANLTNCSTMYTTNYDDFIERSLRLRKKSVNVVTSEASMGQKIKDFEVIKFHGDWNDPDAMVFSESDYEKRLKLETALDYRLRADLLGRAVLFLGYSFRDPNISYLFRTVNDQFNNLPGSLSGRRAYIAVPEPSDFEIQLFGARNMDVIKISSTDPSNDIAALLDQIRS